MQTQGDHANAQIPGQEATHGPSCSEATLQTTASPCRALSTHIHTKFLQRKTVFYWSVVSNCSQERAVSLMPITNISVQQHTVAANWSPCRWQTLRPEASWSQPASSSNSVATSRMSHTPIPRPSRQPAVHTWQTARWLAKEDLYLVFDLLEFASILVQERVWLWGKKGHRDPRSSSDASG